MERETGLDHLQGVGRKIQCTAEASDGRQILWGSPKIRYWIQLADHSSTEYPPVRAKEGLATLRKHDWPSALRKMHSLEAAKQEFCRPGIGFVDRLGHVFHICPNEDGTATCFYLAQGRNLYLDLVSADEQARLLTLFYRRDRVRLARAFGDVNIPSQPEPIWRDIFRQLLVAAKPAAYIVVVAFLIIAAILFLTALRDGVPFVDAVRRLVSSAPFLLLLQVGILGGVILIFGPIAFAMMLFERKGWTVRFEGHDYTAQTLVAIGLIAMFSLLALFLGRWGDYPIEIGNIACVLGPFVWPVYLMGRFRRQQDRILDKIRAHFVLASTALMIEDAVTARERLRTIRRLEGHWRLGASGAVRLAHISYAAITNLSVAFIGQVFGYHLNSQMKPASLADTVLFLLGSPWLLATTVGIAFLFSIGGLRNAIQVQSRPWSEFYGNRLEAALNAGRGVDNAPRHDLPPLLEGVTAHELLGLRPGFTKAELRSAWLKLARELHPDKWTSSGPGVIRVKESALKRVNAARDELATQAI